MPTQHIENVSEELKNELYRPIDDELFNIGATVDNLKALMYFISVELERITNNQNDTRLPWDVKDTLKRLLQLTNVIDVELKEIENSQIKALKTTGAI